MSSPAASPALALLNRRSPRSRDASFQRKRREAAADAVARGEKSPGSPLARSLPASPAVSREGSYRRPASFQRASKKAAPDLFERAAGKPRAPPPQCSVAISAVGDRGAIAVSVVVAPPPSWHVARPPA